MDFNPFYIPLLDIPKITPKKVTSLLNHFRDPEKVFRAKEKELRQIAGLDEETISQIRRFNLKTSEEKIRKAEKLKLKILSFLDEGYPKALLSIKYFPPILFVQGEIKEEDEKALAIVGTRNPSPTGQEVAEKFASELAESGLTIISGLARGIDTAAHLGALKGKGRTIAVLGCGIDISYPPENENLRERIVEQGAVISEYNIQTLPERFNFPRRNRIISGLALGVLAIEAPEKSGVLITAWWAGEQGKPLFVTPGPITSKRCEGTNRLLKEGATLVTSVSDILENLGMKRGEKRELKVPLSPEEEAIVGLISEAPLYIDEIVERLERPVQEILTQLFSLEIKGVVRQLPGNRYIKIF